MSQSKVYLFDTWKKKRGFRRSSHISRACFKLFWLYSNTKVSIVFFIPQIPFLAWMNTEWFCMLQYHHDLSTTDFFSHLSGLNLVTWLSTVFTNLHTYARLFVPRACGECPWRHWGCWQPRSDDLVRFETEDVQQSSSWCSLACCHSGFADQFGVYTARDCFSTVSYNQYIQNGKVCRNYTGSNYGMTTVKVIYIVFIFHRD